MTNLKAPDQLFLEIGGIPFVDERFNPAKLLTLVAILRRNVDNGSNALNMYLDPDLSVQIYSRRRPEHITPPPHTELSQQERDVVEATTGDVIDIRPDWIGLFSIPLRFKRLSSDEVSSTHPMIPQHVYFGRRAISDAFLLAETLIHELSHVWNGFILEIFDWQIEGCPNDYILPSGTSGKDVRGVLFAGLFAAAALSFYLSKSYGPLSERASARVAYLQKYLGGCLETLHRSQFVSPTGRLLARGLENFADNLSPTPSC